MSIEQIIRITISFIILYVMLIMMGELETLKWMLIVIGLAIAAVIINKICERGNKD